MLQLMDNSNKSWTPTPAKVKNLWITAWCPRCKKVQSYSGLILLGSIADTDPDAVPAPEMCSCGSVSFNLTLNQNIPVRLQSNAEREHEQLQRALRIVQAVAACDGFEDNWLTFCNPERKEEIARQYVSDALALLHEAGWC
jgi:hypothetical protein